jgi:PAS domain S-box-containing protein
MRLVVVEDHPIILNVITTALSAVPGYHVVACPTAASGLAACDAGTDLAIFDHRLPDLTGIEAVRRLRAEPLTQHLPVIIITGDSDTPTRLAAIQAGATDFLEKPVLIDELRLRVRNLLALREAQKQASQGQALLETLIAATGAHVAVADAQAPDAPVIYLSAPLAAEACVAGRAIHGRSLRDLWSHTPPSEGRDRLEQAVRDRAAGRFVLPAPRTDGEPRWIEVALTPVADGGRPPRHLVLHLQDVTDLVETRQANDRLSSRLADIARISGAWFFEFGPDLRLTYVSAAMARALGTTPEEITGQHLDALPVRLGNGGRDQPRASTLLAPPHRALDHQMVSFLLPDGQLRRVQISATPFHDASGAFAGYRGHAGDVSEIARARDLAAQASRAKSVFLDTMSHEMRTPLTAIIGLSEALARDPLTSDQHGHLAQIGSAALRLSEVLSDVLDAASMERGKPGLQVAPFDPVPTAERALAPFREAARSRGLWFELSIEGAHLGPRLGDSARMARIMQALASNAVKFTERGGVAVRLDLSDPGAIRLTVNDSGIGMRPEDQQSALIPFVQGDDGIARRFEGTGLGLSIVQWLTDAMGGRLALRSAPGQGTTVTLWLPLALSHSPVPPAPDRAADLSGWRVLVADDNVTNRKVLQLMLQKLGADVTLCADGTDALAQWRNCAFDLLLLDINMPQMAGTDVIRSIRSAEVNRGSARVPALAVTASACPDQVALYRQAGFDDCVAKPLTTATLSHALRRLSCDPAPTGAPLSVQEWQSGPVRNGSAN